MKLQSEKELEILTLSTRATNKIKGACVEIGVYWGYSAKIISSNLEKRKFYLIDSFSGFRNLYGKENIMNGYFSFEKNGQNCYDYVSALNLPNSKIIKGFFPDCSGELDDDLFSFVHIDVDTKESTKECLDFFYPRLSRGGIILIHDYFNDGLYVKEAVDSFSSSLSRSLILFRDSSQALIWK